jgi:prepilin-type N-terminal cleavage/methylation domain-containing protein
MSRWLPSSRIADPRGFTLLEVLIAIVLLIFISLAIFQATTGAYRLRDNLMHDGDFQNGLRLAVSVIERDIGMAFTPLSMKPSPAPSASATASASASSSSSSSDAYLTDPDLQRSTEFWSGAVDNTGLRPSRFQGSEKKLSFVSASHLRVYKDAPESDFLKVTYTLDPDSSSEAVEGTSILKRTIDTRAFDLEEKRDPKTIKTYSLLRGVSEFKWRFYSKAKQQWLASWDSDTTEPKNAFPELIELTVSIKGKRKQTLDGTYIFKVEVLQNGIPKTF